METEYSPRKVLEKKSTLDRLGRLHIFFSHFSEVYIRQLLPEEFKEETKSPKPKDVSLSDV